MKSLPTYIQFYKTYTNHQEMKAIRTYLRPVICDELFHNFIHRRERSACVQLLQLLVQGRAYTVRATLHRDGQRGGEIVTMKVGFPSLWV